MRQFEIDYYRQIVEEQYKMKIPLTTVGDYLKKWGVNSNLITEFETNFVKKIGRYDFLLTKKKMMKKSGLILWVIIMKYESKVGNNIYNIAN